MNGATPETPEGPYQSPASTHSEAPLPASPQSSAGGGVRPLRVWPAVVLLVVLWLARIIPGFLAESTGAVMMMWFLVPLACVLLILVWWSFLSRALVREKLLGLLGLVLVLIVTTMLADKSIRGFGTVIFAVPWGFSAFTLALIAMSRAPAMLRTGVAVLAALVGFGFWDLVRTDEIRADFQTARSWRWEPTAEERFLETLESRKLQANPVSMSEAALANPDWPEFRGPERNGVQPGIILSEDWDANRPTELWRIPIGPGWSSFSVAGGRLYTQEQRGDQEAVVCYDAGTGEQIWVHQDASRFWEVVGGAGPRGTPTLRGGGLFTLGANGLLHRLDPGTGESIWQRDLQVDAGRAPPGWGFSSSPLVAGGLVIVHAGGSGDKGMLAYDAETGELRWSVAAGDHSYSSPQLARVDGVECVLMLTNQGLIIVDPSSGRLLGEHSWEFQGYRVVQPLMVGPSSVLLGTPMGTGTRRLELESNGDEITASETWTSRRMNPYFNDYVAHDGYLYGFDNNIFACIDLKSGKRQWKQGRYGNGQVVLLPDGEQLLVLSEDGELVLLKATPAEHRELGRIRVLDGRTWNHPVVVGNRVYVRNGEEAACYELAIESPVGIDADPGPADVSDDQADRPAGD